MDHLLMELVGLIKINNTDCIFQLSPEEQYIFVATE